MKRHPLIDLLKRRVAVAVGDLPDDKKESVFGLLLKDALARFRGLNAPFSFSESRRRPLCAQSCCA